MSANCSRWPTQAGGPQGKTRGRIPLAGRRTCRRNCREHSPGWLASLIAAVIDAGSRQQTTDQFLDRQHKRQVAAP